MMEVLCARSPAALRCGNLEAAAVFYRHAWGFALKQTVPGVFALMSRESVTVQLWQRRADESLQTLACRLLVNCIDPWQLELVSAPGQAPASLTEQPWGCEWGISDAEGNRLLLVQSAPHAVRRAMRARQDHQNSPETRT